MPSHSAASARLWIVDVADVLGSSASGTARRTRGSAWSTSGARASGVTSRAVTPVPPVAITTSTRRRRSSGAGASRSCHELVGDDRAARRSRCPARSSRSTIGRARRVGVRRARVRHGQTLRPARGRTAARSWSSFRRGAARMPASTSSRDPRANRPGRANGAPRHRCRASPADETGADAAPGHAMLGAALPLRRELA